MGEAGWAALADLALKAGVPTALGCAIVWYLLWHHIPRLISTFEAAVSDLTKRDAEQRDDYKQTLKAQVEASRELVHLLRASISEEADENRRHRSEEATRTREAIAVLAKQTQRLSESVYRLHGAVGVDIGVAFERSGEPAPERTASPAGARKRSGGA
jgi:hypothetical protein